MVAITLQDLPDYLYLISGVCQLFIVVQIIMSWQSAEEVNNHSQDSEKNLEALERHVRRLKKSRYVMLAVFCLFLITSLTLFFDDLLKKQKSIK
jgi:uncharacterized membrane protein